MRQHFPDQHGSDFIERAFHRKGLSGSPAPQLPFRFRYVAEFPWSLESCRQSCIETAEKDMHHLHLVAEHLHVMDINFTGMSVFSLFEKKVQ